MNIKIDDIPCGFIITDGDFAVLHSNSVLNGIVGHEVQHFASIISIDVLEETIYSIKEQLSFTKKFNVKTKLLKKRGYIWAHISGNMSGENINMTIVDISEHFLALEQLEHEHGYIELILSLSDDAFFDYDIPNDTIRISPDFAAELGISETIRGYPESITESKVIAPDSRHFFTRDRLKHGKGAMEEVHFRLANGENAWYSIYYNVGYDENGDPVRVAGKIVDITDKVERIAELRGKAEHDSLTKLYNKEEAHARIEKNLLDRRRGNSKSALMMIDIDNFKGVNDTLGHTFGDKVLKDVAQKLKKAFRDTDIVGRFGGDEFIVLMKNVDSPELIEKKAMAITDAFRNTFSGEKGDYKISGSVGIAIFPDHGTTFDDLCRHADEALYISKRRGKDCYTIYQG